MGLEIHSLNLQSNANKLFSEKPSQLKLSLKIKYLVFHIIGFWLQFQYIFAKKSSFKLVYWQLLQKSTVYHSFQNPLWGMFHLVNGLVVTRNLWQILIRKILMFFFNLLKHTLKILRIPNLRLFFFSLSGFWVRNNFVIFTK